MTLMKRQGNGLDGEAQGGRMASGLRASGRVVGLAVVLGGLAFFYCAASIPSSCPRVARAA